MANVDGVNYAKAVTSPSAGNILDPGLLGGRVRVIQESYEASALATGNVILCGQALPKGSQVVLISLGNDALSGTAVLQVGDEGSASRYLSASASAISASTGIQLPDGLGYVITGVTDNIIRITNTGSAGSTATGTIKLVVFYAYE